MLRVPPLSGAAEKELTRMTRQEKGAVVLRAQLILWAAYAQQSVPQLAQRMGWSEKKVRFWVKRFLQEGPQGLYDRSGRGRKPKHTPQIKEELENALDRATPPEHTGYACWTISLVMGWLWARFGIRVHASTVRRWIHSLDFRFNRPKTEPQSNDPQKDGKLKRISDLLRSVKLPDVLLYMDETTLRLLPVIRGMWMRIAKQVRIPTSSGWNQSIKVFGILNATTGQLNYELFDKCNAENFIAFLERVLEVYPKATIYMILDNASWHKAHLVQDFLATHPRIELVWLPTGCPKLNPVERIWRRLKDRVAADHWYGTLDAIRTVAVRFLDALSPEKTLQISGIAA